MLKKRLLCTILLVSMLLSLLGGFAVSVSATTADTITCETRNVSDVRQNWIFLKVTVNSTDYWVLKNKNTLKCLSYYLDSNNAEVIAQLPYVEGDSKQLWTLNLYNATNKYFNLINKANSKYLQLGNGASTVAGNGLKFSLTHVGGSTAFYFNGVASFVNGSTYHMQSVSPQFGIQGNGDAFVNSYAVTAQASNSQLNQQWKIDKITTVNSVDYYTFTNAYTEKVLTYNGLIFTQEDYVAGNDEQLWKIEFSTQAYLIINKGLDGNIVLANGLTNSPGALNFAVKTTAYNTNGYGKFLFNGATTFESGSTYTVRSYYPSYYLNAEGAISPSLVRVMDMITEINNLNVDLIKASDVAAVNLAQEHYDALTTTEQAKVTNYKYLVNALNALTPISAFSEIGAGEARIVLHGANSNFGYVPDVGGLNYGIGHTTAGDKISIPNTDFGLVGAANVTIKATAYNAGEKFGLYLDNDYNNLIGEFTLPVSSMPNLDLTGAQTITIDISSINITGIHTVNIKWTSSVGSFFSVAFVEKAFSSNSFNVANSHIKNITPSSNLTVSTLLSDMVFGSSTTYSFKNGLTTLANSDKVGTGTTLEVTNGTTTTYTIIIYGDVTGDGNISVDDLSAMKLHLLKSTSLTDAKLLAGEINNAGSVTISDLLAVKKQLLGIFTINQNR